MAWALSAALLFFAFRPVAFAQALELPQVSQRWVGGELEISFQGKPGQRYLLEISRDGGLTWEGRGPWRNGTVGGVTTLTLSTSTYYDRIHFRVVVQRCWRRMAGGTPADLNHILISGQSNAIGRSDGDFAPLTTSQPFANVMFNPFVKRRHYNAQGAVGVAQYQGSGLRAPHSPLSRNDPMLDGISWLVRDSAAYRTEGVVESFVPLVESVEPLLGTSVQDYLVFESMASTIANTLTARHGARFLVSCHGVGSCPIEELNKAAERDAHHAVELASMHPGLTGWATGPYANGLHQVIRGQQLARAQGMSYRVQALVWIQADGTDDPGYHRQVDQLINDYNTDIKTLTGQEEDVVVFMEQAQWEPVPAATAVDFEYLEIHEDSDPTLSNGGRAFLVGPRYPESCRVHYKPRGVRGQGGRYANAMERVLFQASEWEPTSPRAVRVEGAVVEIDFHVPCGSLQVGTTPNLGPIEGTLGFAIRDDQGTNLVRSAAIVDGDTVRLVCGASPVGRVLTYARDKAGAGSVQRGMLCDSSPPPTFYKEADGSDLDSRNFCIAFEAPIPWAGAPQITTAAVEVLREDSDRDGLPDSWEIGKVGVLPKLRAGADFDGDGGTDDAEWSWGTDPSDPTDALRILDFPGATDDGVLRLRWAAVPGRRYEVSWSADLMRWTPLPGAFGTVASEGHARLQRADLGGPGAVFVRVRPWHGDRR